MKPLVAIHIRYDGLQNSTDTARSAEPIPKYNGRSRKFLENMYSRRNNE